MATLKEPIKIFIVQSLACMETPQQVADAVKQEFGIELDRRQCSAYDPTKPAGKNLSKKLKQLFEETRRNFQENILDIPLANKAFRLKELQDMYTNTGGKPLNRVIRQKLLKQAKDEMSGHDTQLLNNALLRLELGRKEAEDKEDDDSTININIVRVGRRDGS